MLYVTLLPTLEKTFPAWKKHFHDLKKDSGIGPAKVKNILARQKTFGIHSSETKNIWYLPLGCHTHHLLGCSPLETHMGRMCVLYSGPMY